MSSTIVPTRSAAADLVDTRKEGGVWPLRRTIAFVLVVCGAFWIAVGVAVAYLIKAL